MADKLFRDYYNEKTEEVSLPVDGKLLVQTGTDEPDKIDVDLFATAAQGLKADGAIQKIGSQVVNAFLDIQNPLKANVYRFKIQNVLNANNVSSEFITGANSFLLATHTTGSLNFPEDQGQAAFFEGSSDGRDFAIWKNALVESDIRLGYKNGSNEWIWRKLPYTDEVATAAQGVLAETALQPFIDNTNVIFRNDGANTFNISRNGNIDGSSPFLDMLNDSSSTRLRATGGLSFWNRPLNGTLSESARFTENGYFGIGTLTPTERIEVSGNVKANSFLTPLVTLTASTTLTVANSTVIMDASGGSFTATLPLITSVPIGKEYNVVIYSSTNSAIIQTSGTDQIRQQIGDTDTSRTNTNTKVINTGTYWQLIN